MVGNSTRTETLAKLNLLISSVVPTSMQTLVPSVSTGGNDCSITRGVPLFTPALADTFPDSFRVREGMARCGVFSFRGNFASR